MSVLDKLTEGIVNRDLQKEGAALLNKWEKTGLLEGLDNDQSKDSMARLLENQAKELLREQHPPWLLVMLKVLHPLHSQSFAVYSVALIANDLVSVQPMSLPSGLIFFLDFTTKDRPSPASRWQYAGDSQSTVVDVVGKAVGQVVLTCHMTLATDDSSPEQVY